MSGRQITLSWFLEPDEDDEIIDMARGVKFPYYIQARTDDKNIDEFFLLGWGMTPEEARQSARTQLADLIAGVDRLEAPARPTVQIPIRWGVAADAEAAVRNAEGAAHEDAADEAGEAAPYRASQDVICATCQKTYGEHPMATEPQHLSFDQQPYLHRLCNGDLVKL